MLPLPAKCNGSSYVAHTFSEYFLHTCIVLELPFSLFAVYCIANVTPKQMFLLKVLLLAHQMWVTYYSFLINVGMVPVIFFPDIVMYTRGLFDVLDVPITLQAYLLGTAFAGMMLSILGLFAYRHQCVLPERSCMKMRTGSFVVFNGCLHGFAFFYMIPQIVGAPDQTLSIEGLQQGPNAPCDLWDPHLYVFFYGLSKLLIFYGVFIMTCSNLMAFYIYHSFRSIRISRQRTSKSTRKKQIGFLYALILMAVIPNTLLCFPVAGLIIGTASSVAYNPVFGEILACCLSVHGLASTVTLIMSVKPYKQAAVVVFRRVCGLSLSKQNVVQIEVSTKSNKF